jgi:NAD dependent epimerase/dehydratase family enzyme
MKGPAPEDSVRNADAVIHLAGEQVAQRWNADAKRRIRESRVVGTRNLVQALARLRNPPRALICASAVGYYGSRGDEVLRED